MIKSKRGRNKKNSNTLFITYDGILDPLGSSQILPYLFGLASKGVKVHILSFEKEETMKI